MAREILHLKKSKGPKEAKDSGAINQHKRMAMGLPISAGPQGKAGKGKK